MQVIYLWLISPLVRSNVTKHEINASNLTAYEV